MPTSASGTIDFADVDLTDTHTVSAARPRGGYLGTFTPTHHQRSTGDGAGQVSWNFSVANSALQFLAEDQTLTQTYTVTVSRQPWRLGRPDRDHHYRRQRGRPDHHRGGRHGAVTEDTLPTSASGTINFADVDLNDTHTVLGRHQRRAAISAPSRRRMSNDFDRRRRRPGIVEFLGRQFRRCSSWPRTRP